MAPWVTRLAVIQRRTCATASSIRQVGGVEQMASGRFLQGGNRAPAVAAVAFPDLLRKGGDTSIDSFPDQLLIAPVAPALRQRR